MALSKFLDPKNDISFKRIFGTEKNKDILIHFLNDILGFTGKSTIKDIEFLSTIQDPDIASKKQSIVDVLCRDENGSLKLRALKNVLNTMLLKPIQDRLTKAINIMTLKKLSLLL